MELNLAVLGAGPTRTRRRGLVTSLAPPGRRLITALAACFAVSLAILLGSGFAPAPAQAHHYDYLLPAPGTCGSAESGDMTKSYTDWVAAGMCLIDKARANAGRIRRTPYNELNTSSYYKASDISVCEPDPNDANAVHHACGRPIDYWFKWSNPGACYQTAFAENVYIGYGSASTAREAVSWWLHSDAHRSALLSPDYWGHYLNYSGPTTYRGTPNTRIWVYHMARCYTYTTGG